MSLTTQAFTYAFNHIENLTDFIQDRVSKLIQSNDNDYDKDTIFVVFTTFDKGVFAPHVMAESEFHASTLVDMYALNLTVLAVANGNTLISDYGQTKTWFSTALGRDLKEAQTLDTNANALVQASGKTIIGITNYDMQLPLKSFLLKTGQDRYDVRANLDKHVHIIAGHSSIVKDMVDWYYEKLMEKSLGSFLNDPNYGLKVLNDITERVTYVIHQEE